MSRKGSSWGVSLWGILGPLSLQSRRVAMATQAAVYSDSVMSALSRKAGLLLTVDHEQLRRCHFDLPAYLVWDSGLIAVAIYAYVGSTHSKSLPTETPQ